MTIATSTTWSMLLCQSQSHCHCHITIAIKPTHLTCAVPVCVIVEYGALYCTCRAGIHCSVITVAVLRWSFTFIVYILLFITDNLLHKFVAVKIVISTKSFFLHFVVCALCRAISNPKAPSSFYRCFSSSRTLMPLEF